MRHVSLLVLTGALLLGAPGALAVGVAVGGFGGYNVPILQDDAGPGPMYGARVKLKAGLPFVIQPYVLMASEGDITHSQEGMSFTQEGGSLRSCGLDLSLGAFPDERGTEAYVVGGIGSCSRDPRQKYLDKTRRFGIDLGIGVVSKVAPMLDIDVCAKVLAFTLDEGGSRKSLGVTAGLHYYFAQ